MRPPTDPPRAAYRFLRRVLPPGPATDSLLGDLHEEYLRVTPSVLRGPWYIAAAMPLAIGTLLKRKSDSMSTPTPDASRPLSGVLNDITFASRLLRRRPGFSAVAIATLALGIGANSAIFSVVNRTLLASLPFGAPEQLVAIWETIPSAQIDENTPAPATLDIWRSRANTVERFAAYTTGTANLTGGGEPERVSLLRTSADLLPTLQMPLALGRGFTADEDRFGGPRAVILSNRLWTRRFQRDPQIVGRAIVVNGTSATVVGVLPDDVPLSVRDSDLWAPLALTPSESPQSRMLWIVARMKPSVTAPVVQKDLDTVMHRAPGGVEDGIGVNVKPFDDELRGGVRPDLLLVFAVSAVVLLIACTNVATMLLARGVARQRELRVRASLGAGRLRLARLLIIESLALGVCGGIAGLAMSVWALRIIELLMPPALASTVSGGIDLRVLAFTTALALATTVLIGVVPALGMTGRRLITSGRASGDDEHGTLRLVRRALVVVEVALAVILLAAAGLLIRSFTAIVMTPTGFSAQSVLTAQVYRADMDDAQRTSFYNQLIEQLSSLPGVEAVGLINGVPLRFTGGGSGFLIDDGQTPGHFVSGHHRIVSSGYLRAIGIPIIRGEGFRGTESDLSERVAVVSDSFATAAWGDAAKAIGRQFKWGADGTWIRVIGVAGDIRLTRALPIEPHVYLPFTQIRYSVYMPSDVVIKTTSHPIAIGPDVRQAVRRLDANQPVASVLTLEELLDRSVGRRRFTLTLMASFAGLALVLSAIGIYGVISYLVGRRTREIGIRLAIGASTGQVRRGVLWQGLALAVLGVGIGSGVSLELAQWIRTMVPGLAAPQAMPMVAAGVLLLSVAAIACDIPARRAMKIDPMIALRAD